MTASIRLSNRSSPQPRNHFHPLFLFAVKLCSRLSFRQGVCARDPLLFERNVTQLKKTRSSAYWVRLFPDFLRICPQINDPLMSFFHHHQMKHLLRKEHVKTSSLTELKWKVSD